MNEQFNEARREIDNDELPIRLGRIAGSARKVPPIIEDDLRGPRCARKFLNTYLEEVQKVAKGYVKGTAAQGSGTTGKQLP